MKQWVIPAWIPVAVVAAVALVLASARDIDRTYQKTFADLEPGTRLVLRHGDGDVIVVPWERDAIEVDVDYHVSVARLGFGSAPDLDVDLRRYGETVEVLGRERGTVNVGILFFSREHEHVYRIKAPPWVRLHPLRGIPPPIAGPTKAGAFLTPKTQPLNYWQQYPPRGAHPRDHRPDF